MGGTSSNKQSSQQGSPSFSENEAEDRVNESKPYPLPPSIRVEQDVVEETLDELAKSLRDKVKEAKMKGIRERDMIVLVAGGSYNPVHKAHLEIFEIVQGYARRKLGLHVIAGFFVASTRRHVKHKCGSTWTIKKEHRLRMCDIASQNISYLQTFPFAWSSATNAGSAVVSRLKKQYGVDIDYYNVIGSDWLDSDGRSWEYHLYSENTFCISRGDSEMFNKYSRTRKDKLAEGFHFVDRKTRGNVSSTKIRRYLEENDWHKLKDFMSSSVIEYMRDHWEDLFLDPALEED